MWKVCQNPETGEIKLIHLGYDVPKGFFELTITSNPNYIQDEEKALAESIGMTYVPGTPIIDYFTLKVDLIADEVYLVAVSSPAKLEEYKQAELDALAYMQNKSVRQPYVKVWAEAKRWTDEEAALDILKTAGLFKHVMLTIRQQRLTAKEKIRRSSGSLESMKKILQEYILFMDQLKVMLVSG